MDKMDIQQKYEIIWALINISLLGLFYLVLKLWYLNKEVKQLRFYLDYLHKRICRK